jgi:hypothetical protein
MKMLQGLLGYFSRRTGDNFGPVPRALCPRSRRSAILNTAILETLESRLLLSGTPPIVMGVNSTLAGQSAYGAGSIIPITVIFSDQVFVAGGTPTLTLNVGGSPAVVNYSQGSGTNTLEFDYRVAAGQNASKLECEPSNALLLNGATIKDVSGGNAFLALPAPGSPQSLSSNAQITIDTTAPAAPVILSPTSSGVVPNSVSTITGTAEANALVNVIEAGDGHIVGTQQLVNGGTNFSIDATLYNSANSSTANYLAVVAIDAAGNSSSTTLPVIYSGSPSQSEGEREPISDLSVGAHQISNTSILGGGILEDQNWSTDASGSTIYDSYANTAALDLYTYHLTYSYQIPLFRGFSSEINRGEVVANTLADFTTDDPSLQSYTGVHVVPYLPLSSSGAVTYTLTFDASLPSNFDRTTSEFYLGGGDGSGTPDISLNGNNLGVYSVSDPGADFDLFFDSPDIISGTNTLQFQYDSPSQGFQADAQLTADYNRETLTAQPNSANGSISLQWNQPDPNVTNYKLERSDGYGIYQTIYNGSNATYVDNNVISGVNYTYQIITTTSSSASAYSNAIEAKVGPEVPPAIVLTAPSTSLLGSSVSLQANVLDNYKNDPVQKVQFFANGTSIGWGRLIQGNGNSGEWSIAWTPGSGGTYQMMAVAVTADDVSGTSNIINVNVTVPTNLVYSYFDDFENGPVGPEWSSGKTEVTPIGDRRYLGEFGWHAGGEDTSGNDKVDLSLSNIPEHDEVTLDFDLYVLRTMGGNSDGGIDTDAFDVDVLGGPQLLRTTFSNNAGSPQAYPGGISDTEYWPSYAPQTGAVEVNTLGYYYYGEQDSVYHLTFTFPDDEQNLVLQFFSENKQPLSDESWGIDNVQVTAGWHGGTALPTVQILDSNSTLSANSTKTVVLRASANSSNPSDSITGVTFYDNGTPLPPASLVNGIWQLEWAFTTPGINTVTAVTTDAFRNTGHSVLADVIEVANPDPVPAPVIQSISDDVTGSNGTLHATIADGQANSNTYIYSWALISVPPDGYANPPQLDEVKNGTNAGKDLNVTNLLPGSYCIPPHLMELIMRGVRFYRYEKSHHHRAHRRPTSTT